MGFTADRRVHLSAFGDSAICAVAVIGSAMRASWIALEAKASGRVDISAIELAHLPLWPVQTVRVDMVEHRWAAQIGHKGRAPD